ncbi:flagellar hook capping protein [Ruminococcaceae bacterium OttesenSCG-928-L11]|nr:flagellar hook capping protein [Ruminococcaceae bacterium OttesenSCG-928-L11]
MATANISDYLGASGVTDTSNLNKKKTRGDSELGIEDFMKLMVAQLQNQDVMNPVDDTQFIAQMAQFSSLQVMQNLQEYTMSAYAVSYVGKNVLIATEDEKSGRLKIITGVVEKVTFSDGNPKVFVDGKEYDLHKVMEIADEEIVVTDDTKKDTDTKTDTDGE